MSLDVMKDISLTQVKYAVQTEATEPQHVYASGYQEVHIRDYWKILVKRRRLLIVILLACLSTGAYVTLTATPVFRATAIIKIEPQNPMVTGIEMLRVAEGGGPYDYYQTQFKLLESRSLAAKIITELNLESNDDFTQTSLTSSNVIGRFQSATFGYLHFFVSGIASWLGNSSRISQGSKATGPQRQNPDAAADVKPHLVGRYVGFLNVSPVKNTRLVQISFQTPGPDLSQMLANAHASGFIRMNLETRSALTKEARDFLDAKNIELKRKVELAEESLNRFRQKYGVVSLDKGENIVVDRLITLNKELTTARAQRIEAESLYKTIENKSTQQLSQILTQGLVSSLRGNILNLEAERTKISAALKPEHPRVVEIGQQINEARRALNAEIANTVRSIEQNYVAARAKEQALQAEALNQQQIALNLKEVGVEYVVLEEEVRVNRTLYESVLKRLNETNVSNDLAVSNIQVMQRAERPGSPSSPDIPFNLVLTSFLGIFLGVGLAFFLEYLDSTVSTPQRVWRAVALNTFGVVPHLASLNRKLFRYRPSWREIPLIRKLVLSDLTGISSSPKDLIVSHHPLSLISESYRTIRSALLFSQAEKPPQVILLTSPSPGEGKTVTTLNLGIALVQDGHRVLIIDADLRKGSCHTRLGIKNHRGLSNVLTGNLSLEEGIRETSVCGLSLLSHGLCPPNPSNLLGSHKMRETLNTLRQSFDFVLIDSPPVIAVSDAAVLAVICDGVVLVFNGRQTTTAWARQAVERLTAVRAPVLGVILNAVDLDNPDYAYYRYYYGSNYGERGDEPENSAGITIDTVADKESPEIERKPMDQGQETVSQDFLNHMTSKLTEAAGPTAPLISGDQIAILGESQKTFPKGWLKELFKKVSEEIFDERVRTHFQRSIEDQLNPLSHTDLSEGEISPGELGPGHVPQEFFDHMTSELYQAAGPMAPLIIRDQIDRLGELSESFPKTRLKELVELICTEILNQKLKSNFQQTMLSEIRSL